MKIKKAVFWYLLGFATSVVLFFSFFIIMEILGKLETDADMLISKWNIAEEAPDALVIRLFNELDEPIIISVEKQPQNGNSAANCLYRISFRAEKEKQPPMLMSYLTTGEYKKPSFFYGSIERIVWQDLNADGIFDRRIDYSHKVKEIYIEDRWVLGHGKGEVTTEGGIFVFNADLGKWQEQ